MSKIQQLQLVLACLTICSLIGIGVSIAIPSIIYFIISISGTFLCCGLGFSLKRISH